MKQMTLTTIPLLCAAFAPLCADAQGMQSDEARSARQQKYMDEMNKITPSGEPAVTRCADPYGTADFIWWRAQEDGLDYAVKGVTPFIHDADSGHVHHPHFSYEPGFKVGAGLKFRHDGWDLFAQYTWLRVHNDRNHVHTDSDGDANVQSNIMMPDGSSQLITFFAEHASARWKLNFNVLDLELGRNFWISKRLTLRPFIGMKFDWMDQDFKAHYDDVEFSVFSFPAGNLEGGEDVRIKMDQDQWAVGLRAGLNTSWYMWKHWTIFGDIAFSGMLNDFDIKRKDRVQNTLGQTWIQNNLRRSNNSVTAVLEWALGLRFETAFHNDDWLFQFQAGWEQQVWFNQNQFIFLPNAAPADLSFQGLTIKAAFYF